MPLTAKGKEILGNFRKEYGAEGDRVFYASKNAGKITGVDSSPSGPRDSDHGDPYDISGYMDSVSRGDAAGAMDRLLKRRADR